MAVAANSYFQHSDKKFWWQTDNNDRNKQIIEGLNSFYPKQTLIKQTKEKSMRSDSVCWWLLHLIAKDGVTKVKGWEDLEQASFESLCIYLAARSFNSQSKVDAGYLMSGFETRTLQPR